MSEIDQWPRTGDVLFTSGGNWLDACVGFSYEQWHEYIEGYKRGAELLVQHVTETLRSQDCLIYPIVFMFRHAIEISLKRLLWKGYHFLDRDPIIPKQHRLVSLWRDCLSVFEEVGIGGQKEDLEAVSEVLEQFEAKDPMSTVFRYPLTTSGTASLPTSESINIQNFADVAKRVLFLLDCCDTGLSVYLDYKSEMVQVCEDV